MGTRRVPRSVLITVVATAMVTVGVLGGVAVLRVHRNAANTDAPAAAPLSAASPDCGDGPCRVVARQTVQGTQVQLLADASGANGRFVGGDGTVVETAITELGARLTPDSLSCVAATVPVCLISAPMDGGKVAQLVVAHNGNWRSADKPYFSQAGVVTLQNLLGDDTPEVVVVETGPVLARVYLADGSVAACTRRYSSTSQIRGWPEVKLLASDLRACTS